MAPSEDSAFSGALDEYIEEMKSREDPKSSFYREVLMQASLIRFKDGSQSVSQQAAADLSKTIIKLDHEQTKTSHTRRLAATLYPFVSALSQYVGVADVAIQAGPAAATVVYAGARFLLEVRA